MPFLLCHTSIGADRFSPSVANFASPCTADHPSHPSGSRPVNEPADRTTRIHQRETVSCALRTPPSPADTRPRIVASTDQANQRWPSSGFQPSRTPPFGSRTVRWLTRAHARTTTAAALASPLPFPSLLSFRNHLVISALFTPWLSNQVN